MTLKSPHLIQNLCYESLLLVQLVDISLSHSATNHNLSFCSNLCDSLYNSLCSCLCNCRWLCNSLYNVSEIVSEVTSVTSSPVSTGTASKTAGNLQLLLLLDDVNEMIYCHQTETYNSFSSGSCSFPRDLDCF
ncbi:hypothetical protein ISN45_Aa02g008250 [Arabidopsis thaliana x Arabidopsis arenosa]|uniref:Uncharacterized protein n=1 Tax=Arabidopsis thaliana x Arabidopsis arenosa TaxID=1240361 RepID=A0A8T2BP50_9BRAS|nr:hypothetical protein ISN45_Aa02g008250 [Arabidopsis thaliana x Arabidopsis arenosa]